jgi:arsenite methyltransferase
MAYVGCIAGVTLIEDYRRTLVAAGFAHVKVIDSGKDLNAYAKVENQAGCCSPLPAVASLPIADTGCCSPNASTIDPLAADFHIRLTELLKRYDVNNYAASVRVFAVKPR